MRIKAWPVLCFTTLLAATTSGFCQSASIADTAAKTSTAGATEAPKALRWFSVQEPVHRRKETGLPDFGQLNANVWRSGQPTREGFMRLAEMHVKTIVNLRKEFPQEKDMVPKGVNYVYIPITDETAPTEEQGKLFLQVVTNPDNWPVLVHCKGGEGRTGVMCALVRYGIDGWDHDRVMKEVGNFRSTVLGLFKTHLCGSQNQFLHDWEGHFKPGSCLAWIGASQPSQP